MIKIIRGLRLVTRLSMLAVIVLTSWGAIRHLPFSAPPSSGGPAEHLEILGELSTRLSGGPVSVSVFNYELLDPALGLMSAISVPATGSKVALAIVVPVLLTLLLGRVFCGYLCPVGWIATSLARLRNRIVKRIQLPSVVVPTWIGRAFIGIILLVSLAGMPAVSTLFTVQLHLQNLVAHTGSLETMWSALGVVTFFVLVDLLLAPGTWCRSLCPSGVVYELLARVRAVRLVKGGQTSCPKNCRLCNEHCWLQLRPRGGDPGSACDLCLTCAGACPERKLSIGRARWLPGADSCVLIAATLALISVASCHAAADEQLEIPRLDANPPISNSVGLFVAESRDSRRGLSGAVEIHFVDSTETEELYTFSTAVSGEGVVPGARRSVDLVIHSADRRATLRFDEPNSPRSTTDRAVYSGHVWVARDSCSLLNATFSDDNLAVQVRFPRSCETTPLRQFLAGFTLYTVLVMVLFTAGALAMISARKKGRLREK